MSKKRLGDISTIRRGASPRPIGDPKFFSDTSQTGWVRISDVTSARKHLTQTEQYLSVLGTKQSVPVHAGNLIMSICGSVGKAVLVDMEACIHDGFVLISDFHEAIEEYIYYQLQYQQKRFTALGQSGTQTNLNTGIVSNIEVYLPTTTQQEKIAEVLATIDSAIEQTDALIAKFQRIKTGLMQDLFTRGIDENGNLRDPATHAFKDSVLGKIPVEWEVTTLADVGQWVSGGTPSKSNSAYWGGNVPWASPKDMKTLFLENTIDHLTELGAKSGPRCLPTGSILVVVRGMVLINDFPVCQIQQPMTINQDVKGIVTSPEFDSKFLTYWLIISKFKMMRLATEATHGTKRIDMKDLYTVCVPKPNLDEQKQIATIIDVFQRDYTETQQRQQNLRRIKRGLMHDLLTGDVDISPLLSGSTLS